MILERSGLFLYGAASRGIPACIPATAGSYLKLH